jgi:hypothetical protein
MFGKNWRLHQQKNVIYPSRIGDVTSRNGDITYHPKRK